MTYCPFNEQEMQTAIHTLSREITLLNDNTMYSKQDVIRMFSTLTQLGSQQVSNAGDCNPDTSDTSNTSNTSEQQSTLQGEVSPTHISPQTTIFQIHKDSERQRHYKHFQMYQNGNGSKVCPGTIQYKVQRQDLLSFDFNNHNQEEDIRDYFIDENTTENKLRLLPNTPVPNKNDWRLILVIRHESADGGVCLKGALQNIDKPDEIALLNCLNDTGAALYAQRKLKKKTKGQWTALACKMIAPYLFWNTLKQRLLQLDH
jgi:hypothetical protein